MSADAARSVRSLDCHEPITHYPAVVIILGNCDDDGDKNDADDDGNGDDDDDAQETTTAGYRPCCHASASTELGEHGRMIPMADVRRHAPEHLLAPALS